MKNLLFVAIFFAFFAFADNTFAAATTTSNGDPMQVSQSWGLTGHQTVVVPAGTIIVDENGVKDICPTWYRRGCFSLVTTEYYRKQMTDLAKDLLKTYGDLAYKIFPRYSGWYDAVR